MAPTLILISQARKLWEKKAETTTVSTAEPLQLEGEEVALIAADSEVRGRSISEAERVLKIMQRMLSAEHTRAVPTLEPATLHFLSLNLTCLTLSGGF